MKIRDLNFLHKTCKAFKKQGFKVLNIFLETVGGKEEITIFYSKNKKLYITAYFQKSKEFTHKNTDIQQKMSKN